MKPEEINTPVNKMEVKSTIFDMGVSMMRLFAEKPTHCMDVAAELTKNPCVQTKQAHFTVDGVRMVLRYDGDPHHEYEVVINPIRP